MIKNKMQPTVIPNDMVGSLKVITKAEYIVDDEGIKLVESIFEEQNDVEISSTARMILPKEAFVMAYNTYIRGIEN